MAKFDSEWPRLPDLYEVTKDAIDDWRGGALPGGTGIARQTLPIPTPSEIFLANGPRFTKSRARFAMKHPGFFSHSFLSSFPGRYTARSLTVVIDAGHGGQDRGGAPGQRVPEKPYTLAVSQRLAATLREMGVHVILTATATTSSACGNVARLPMRKVTQFS